MPDLDATLATAGFADTTVEVDTFRSGRLNERAPHGGSAAVEA
ncbi:MULTISPECIES: hypothetical protein [Streptomyces]|nr:MULTISPECIES: hypothetical protein [Streptomyces]